MSRLRIADPFLVVSKELTQVANRLSFHLEKCAFAVAAAGIVTAGAYLLSTYYMNPQALAAYGRMIFFTVATTACFLLSAFAVFSSSGIILSEKRGRRLDVLRLTPLTLGTITMGKGLSVLVKSLLVLGILMPIMAALTFLGGVSLGDVAKAMVIIIANVFLATAIGLRVSAGAQSTTDRIVRTTEWLMAWLVPTHFIAMAAVRFAPLPWSTYISSIAPSWIWDNLSAARLPWWLVAASCSLQVIAGVVLSWRAVKALSKGVTLYDTPPDEPKIKTLLAGIAGLSRGGKAGPIRSHQRGWAATPLGNELNQTSLMPILLPFAVSLPPVLVIALASRFDSMIHFNHETLRDLAILLTVVLAVMVAVQACASIAREKRRWTAALLATTPIGDARMLWWKGLAVVLSQAFATLLCLVIVTRASSVFSPNVRLATLRSAGIGGLLLLMLSSGIAFSHCCRGPFHAGAMLVLAFCGLSALVHIAFELVLGTGWGWDSEAAYGVLKEAALIAMIAGVVLLLFRNRAGRGALVFLMAGLALFLGSWSFRVNPNTELWEMLLYPLKWRSFNANTCIRIVACEIVLSVVLVAGAIPRFTDVLLRGARARE